MPLIKVSAAKGALNKTDQDALMSRLADAVLKSEGAPIDDPGAQSLVWAYYHEQPSDTIYVGGKNIEEPPLRISVTTPEGCIVHGK